MPIQIYLWDRNSDNILLETSETGEVTANYTHEPWPHGSLVSENRGTVYTHIHDAGGDSRAVLDSIGRVTRSTTYTAFGDIINTTGPMESPFKYKAAYGYYADPHTGSCNVRSRSYHSALGRWMSKDPLELSDGVNYFAFVRNNPVSLLDTTGLVVIPISYTRVMNRCEFNNTGTPGIEQLRVNPIPRNWDPTMCQGCSMLTCFDTEDGSPGLEQDWRGRKAELTGRINKMVDHWCGSQRRIVVIEVEFRRQCGKLPESFAITCHGRTPGGKVKIHVCVGMLTASRCDTEALISHELQHVEDYLRHYCRGDMLPQVQQGEQRGYRAQCNTWARQCCLEGENDYISKCIASLMTQSTSPEARRAVRDYCGSVLR